MRRLLRRVLGREEKPRSAEPPAGRDGASGDGRDGGSRNVVAPGPESSRAEIAVAALLLLAAASAIAFILVYSAERFGAQHELLGVTLALACAFVAAALIVLAQRVLPSEEIAEDYPAEEHPEDQLVVADTIEETASSITRKRLLVGAGGTAGGALGLAALAPALSLGPWFDTEALRKTPWKPGRRLVDDKGKPIKAEDIETETFYTAFAEGSSQRNIASSVVVVRLEPGELKLPRERAAWAPEGILAFSKICTHAGCAIALYRKPTYGPTQPKPALVCPCHYSTFDPATGGEVVFGPAGRPLPQLPLSIDSERELRAGGNFNNPVGPGWLGVNTERPS